MPQLPDAFITCTADDPEYYVTITTPTLKDAHVWLDAVIALSARPTPPVTGEPVALDDTILDQLLHLPLPGAQLRMAAMQVRVALAPALAAAEQRGREKLDWLAKDVCLELSWGIIEDEEEPCAWRVHRRSGNRSDREWTLIGHGDTPAEAIAAAIRGDETGGENENPS